MTDIVPVPNWGGVRQLETNEYATGGLNGNMNEQAKSLAGQNMYSRLYAGLPFDPVFAAQVGGFPIGGRAALENGDIVRSTVANNTVDPNVDMTYWVKTSINYKNTVADLVSDTSLTTDNFPLGSNLFVAQIESLFECVSSMGDLSNSKGLQFKVKRTNLMTPVEAFGGGIDKTATENTTAILKFLNSSEHTVLVFMQRGTYNHNSINLSGFTSKAFVGGSFGSRQKNTILKNAEKGTSFYGDASATSICFSSLYIQGQVGGVEVTRGVVLEGSECTVRDCWFRYFNDQGLKTGSIATVENCTGWDCCKNYNATTKRGALEIAGNDGYYINLQFGCAQNVPEWQKITSPALNNVGVYVTDGNNMLVNVSGENCDVAIEMTGNGFNRMVNCRADQCWGTGWIVGSSNNEISNSMCENVSLTDTNAYDAFVTNGSGNKLSNCWVRAIARFGNTKLPRYAFYDTVAASQVESRTSYTNCSGQYGTAEFKSETEYLSSPFCDKPIANRSSATTPNVTGTSLIIATGSAVNGFTGTVYSGKEVTLWAASNISLTNSSNFRLRGSRDKILQNNQNIKFYYYNGIWSEVGWQPSDISVATTAELLNKNSTPNTINKYAGRSLWNTGENKQYVASGSSDVAIWYVSDGSGSITPV